MMRCVALALGMCWALTGCGGRSRQAGQEPALQVDPVEGCFPLGVEVTDAQLRVAIVTPNNTLHLQPIVVERDLGATIQIASGITASDRLVQITGADLTEGQKIEPVAPKAPAAPIK